MKHEMKKNKKIAKDLYLGRLTKVPRRLKKNSAPEMLMEADMIVILQQNKLYLIIGMLTSNPWI